MATKASTKLTIRTPVLGAIHEFAREAGISCADTIEAICELSFLLAAYREEDLPLFPEVFVTVDEGVLIAIAPGCESIRIGKGPRTPKTAKDALKKCAALSIDGWSTFIQRAGEDYVFGIFRSQQMPLSVSPSDILRNEAPGLPGPVVLIRNSAPHSVELIAGKGGLLDIYLTSALATARPPSSDFSQFAELVSATVPEEDRADVAGFVTRVFTRACRESHGTLVGLLPEGVTELPAALIDGVVLSPVVDLAAAVRAYRRNPSAVNMATLQGYDSLLRGMISSDGVTILGPGARVFGYRIFVRGSEASTAIDAAHGGARSRAFRVLQDMVGTELRAAFMRSHDGQSELNTNER